MNNWLAKLKEALQVGSKKDWVNNPEATGENMERGYDDWESLNPLISDELLKYSDDVTRDRNKIRQNELSQPNYNPEALKKALIDYQIKKNLQIQSR